MNRSSRLLTLAAVASLAASPVFAQVRPSDEQTDPATAQSAKGAPATSTAPASGETGQAGTMGASQAEGTDASAPPSNAVLVTLGNEQTPVPGLNLMVGQIDEMDVVGADGKEIGEVGSVLGDGNGHPKAITVDVGGFLGIGEKSVIVMLSDISLDMGKLKTALTKQQIEQLPDAPN